MTDQLDTRLRQLEDRLWTEFKTVHNLPPGVPPNLRARLLEQAIDKICKGEKNPADCPLFKMFPDSIRRLDFCDGWCPGCEILYWCPCAREIYTPVQMHWMRANGDFPPEEVETSRVH